MLTTISDVAAEEISVLFEPQDGYTNNHCTQPANVVDDAEAVTNHAEDVDEEPGLQEDTEPDSSVLHQLL